MKYVILLIFCNFLVFKMSYFTYKHYTSALKRKKIINGNLPLI